MLNKLWTFLGLSAKETKIITYTKGYRVSDMMYNLKGLHESVFGAILQRKHILSTKIGLIYHIGRIPLRRKDWPMNINCKLNAAKEYREWQLAFIKQLILWAN